MAALHFADLEPVGPGTPVGRYLCLFWQPVLRARELPSGQAKPVEAPPGIPADRLEALRVSFDAAMADPALLAEAKQSRLDISPTRGDRLQALAAKMIGTSPDIMARAKAAMETKGSIAGETSN